VENPQENELIGADSAVSGALRLRGIVAYGEPVVSNLDKPTGELNLHE
jgi:hypothetical protein